MKDKAQTSYLMVKPRDREQRQEFKERCKELGLSMNKAIVLFMAGVIEGNITFNQKAVRAER